MGRRKYSDEMTRSPTLVVGIDHGYHHYFAGASRSTWTLLMICPIGWGDPTVTTPFR
jgi:hypothetical protein